jgi:hypothetical protein
MSGSVKNVRMSITRAIPSHEWRHRACVDVSFATGTRPRDVQQQVHLAFVAQLPSGDILVALFTPPLVCISRGDQRLRTTVELGIASEHALALWKDINARIRASGAVAGLYKIIEPSSRLRKGGRRRDALHGSSIANGADSDSDFVPRGASAAAAAVATPPVATPPACALPNCQDSSGPATPQGSAVATCFAAATHASPGSLQVLFVHFIPSLVLSACPVQSAPQNGERCVGAWEPSMQTTVDATILQLGTFTCGRPPCAARSGTDALTQVTTLGVLQPRACPGGSRDVCWSEPLQRCAEWWLTVSSGTSLWALCPSRGASLYWHDVHRMERGKGAMSEQLWVNVWYGG